MPQKDYSQPRSRQSRQLRPKKGWKNKIYLIIILISFFWQFYFFIFSDFFKIKKIQVFGNKYIKEKEILTLVQTLLKERYFLILPQDNIFIFSKAKINTLLKDKVSLEEVKINKDLPSKLIITLKEKTPSLIWLESPSGGNSERSRGTTDRNNRYYYLDRNGVVIREMKGEKITSSFPLVQEIGVSEVSHLKPGERMITEKQVTTILNVFEAFLAKESGLKADIFLVNKRLKDEVRLKTKEGFEIYFSCQDPLEKQLENLALILKNKIKGERENLEYIDLRIGDRVYYKLKIKN